jgi:WhiB family transcriptional regulator, redox-sensing transcriptional regulator
MGSFAAHGSRYRGGSGNGGGPGNAGKHFSFQGWGLVQEWEARSACRDTPIELWFGEERPFGDKRSYRTQQQTAQAKAICAGCPVLDDCRQWAMETGPPYGIVGAMTEAERKRLWAEGRAPPKCRDVRLMW